LTMRACMMGLKQKCQDLIILPWGAKCSKIPDRVEGKIVAKEDKCPGRLQPCNPLTKTLLYCEK
jgi:hypothetical protein